MTIPQSPVEICNLALDMVGVRPIDEDIASPETDIGRMLARWYDKTRQTVLREQVWNFAVDYTELPRAGAGKAGYADKYLRPPYMIRINSLGSNLEDPITDYQIFQNYIHVGNAGGVLPIWYNDDITEVARMDTAFIDMLAMRIAQRIAYKITKKPSATENITRLIQTEEPKAVSVDGQERPPIRVEKSKYLAARRQGGTLGRDNRYYDIT